MKKKAYIIPDTTVITVKFQQLMELSGGGEGLTVSPDADVNDADNRSRRFGWDDDDE